MSASRPLTGAKFWSADQIHVQRWLAVPSPLREPRSQRALAAQLELHETTLSDWKKLPGFADAVAGLALEHIKGDLAAVLHAQVAAAKKGSLPHAQWLFELVGKWSPKQRHEHGGAAGGPLRIVIETSTIGPTRAPAESGERHERRRRGRSEQRLGNAPNRRSWHGERRNGRGRLVGTLQTSPTLWGSCSLSLRRCTPSVTR